MLFLPLLFQRRFLARFLFGNSWRSIPFGRSCNFQDAVGKTKSRLHKCVPTRPKGRTPPWWSLVSHLCNRLWNSKSKLSFTLDHCRQLRAISEAAVFSLAYTRALSGLQPFSQSNLWKYIFTCRTDKLSLYIIQNKCLFVKILLVYFTVSKAWYLV